MSTPRRSSAAAASFPFPTLRPPRSPERLHIFDFDSTLVATHPPETGQPLWEATHGRPWPHSGWWGRPESLTALPSARGPAAAAYQAALSDSSALIVLLTGRRTHLSAEVLSVTQAHYPPSDGHGFHVWLLNGASDTLSFKQKAIRRLVQRHSGSLCSVEIYEDREEHAGVFAGLCPPGPPLAWRVHLFRPCGAVELLQGFPPEDGDDGDLSADETPFSPPPAENTPASAKRLSRRSGVSSPAVD
jgi:hypothetical protein